MNVDLTKLFEEPAKEYHSKSREYLSSHQLIDYIKSPSLYYRKICGAANASTEPATAFALGEAAHCVVLEGDEVFAERYASTESAPVNPKTGERYGATSKAYQEWAATQDKKILTPSQYSLVSELAQSVERNEIARELLHAGKPEQVFRGVYEELNCQIRCDWIRDDGILVDYKTCDRLDYFASDARRYRYFNQMAFYRSLLYVATGETFDVRIIATEKQEPYATSVFALAFLDDAENENNRAIELLKKSWETMSFPSNWEELQVISYYA